MSWLFGNGKQEARGDAFARPRAAETARAAEADGPRVSARFAAPGSVSPATHVAAPSARPPAAPTTVPPTGALRTVRVGEQQRALELAFQSLDELQQRFQELQPFAGQLRVDASFHTWMESSAIALTAFDGEKPVTLLAYIAAVRNVVLLSSLRAHLREGPQVVECVVSARCLQDLYRITREKGQDNRDGAAKNGISRTAADSLGEEIISRAIELDASDIHFRLRNAGGESAGRVLFRIDGELEELPEFADMAPQQLHEVLAALYAKSDDKSLASGEGAFNLHRPMSSFIPLPALRGVELRWQSDPERYGIDTVMRVLTYEGKSADYSSLDRLGYLPDQVAMLQEHGHGPGGALLFVGETGAGKSMSMATVVATHPRVIDGTAYAASVEDPPEGRPLGLSQFAVARSADNRGRGQENPFLPALRVRMRSDGDILIIGEIRDRETAEIFAQLAMTGHKPFATFHAGSVKGAYERLTSSMIGMQPETVASESVIQAGCFQLLAPKLCPHCRMSAHGAWTGAAEAAKLHFLAKLGIPTESLYVRNRAGCSQCRAGRKGRQVVAEIFAPTEHQRELIARGRMGEAFRAWRQTRTASLIEPGTTGKTAFEVGLYFASQGVIGVDTLDETIGRILRYEEVAHV